MYVHVCISNAPLSSYVAVHSGKSKLCLWAIGGVRAVHESLLVLEKRKRSSYGLVWDKWMSIACQLPNFKTHINTATGVEFDRNSG